MPRVRRGFNINPRLISAARNHSDVSAASTASFQALDPDRDPKIALTLIWQKRAMMDPSWILYLGIFFGPFVQEDAAVIAAASLSAADHSHFPVIFFVILGGLFLSDIWKYWIGYAAHTSSRARKYAEKEHVLDFRDKVSANLFKTLLTARFVPLARVPVYVACGYFKVSYPMFCLWIFTTALAYCAVIFGLCHGLGEIFGDRIEMIITSIGLTVAAITLITFGLKRRHKARGSSEH